MEMLCERNNATRQKMEETTDNKVESDTTKREEVVEEQRLMDEEENLVILLEQRLQFLLRSLTKLFLSKNTGHNKKEYVAIKFVG